MTDSTGLLCIENAGPEIAGTNYYDTEAALAGFYYASWNAGALRLLVPDTRLADVVEMGTADMVLVTRGDLQGHDALEIMFEDHTDSPFALHILATQTDRVLREEDNGCAIRLTVWSRAGRLLELPGRYRVAESLPYMREWVTH